MSDAGVLAAWLPLQGLALLPGTGLSRLSGGIANRNDRIELTSGPAVLRRPPPGVLAAGASDMAREWRVVSALHPVLPIVPRGTSHMAASTILAS